jgi:hypothetical protein
VPNCLVLTPSVIGADGMHAYACTLPGYANVCLTIDQAYCQAANSLWGLSLHNALKSLGWFNKPHVATLSRHQQGQVKVGPDALMPKSH